MKKDARFSWPVRPLANPQNIIQGKKFRFTILTPRLVRMEYSENGEFEDRATQKVFYRDFPACRFSLKNSKNKMEIETDELIISYIPEKNFSQKTLTFKLKNEPATSWNFGDTYEDLGGTARTLDNVDGPITLERGLCSLWGFSVLNDSESMPLDESGWIATPVKNHTDTYFFGYGFNYKECLKDFYKLTGAPPMLPAYAFGNWWSRYHAYTQDEYTDLIKRFKAEDIPFSVSVVDMDWHIVDVDTPSRIPNTLNGWTGYTWNEKLFPDYKKFLKELHKYNLKVSLNLHPADGIRKHEKMYEEMAIAEGINPESGEPVLLDILSKNHMEHYFDIVLHPYEKDGVDFWWMDWQQGTNYAWIHEPNEPGEYKNPMEKVDPLWMLNHLHITDISHNGKRPMFFSRYAGPGSHRYPVGFSGDTHITWDSLKFQPYFTATASNIGYCWWSHDIGGHMNGYYDKELQIRWLQLGVFSPINRLHSSNSPWINKEPWAYDDETCEIMKKWLRLRHALFPYLYTMNYRCHFDFEPLVLPMYYNYPKCKDAYEAENQYFFGSELMVAPITSPNDPYSKTGQTDVWLPEGEWFDFANGTRYLGLGGRKIEVHRAISEMPVFAKAGAIVPLQTHVEGNNILGNQKEMDLVVFPGAAGKFTLYEDAGDGYDYDNGHFAKTDILLNWQKEKELVICPASGDLSLIPETRKWNIYLRGFNKNAKFSAVIDGKKIKAEGKWEDNTYILSVTASIVSEIRICFSGKELINDNADVPERCLSILQKADIPYQDKETIRGIITDDNLNVRRKIYRFTGRGRQRRGTEWAIRELLVLTEDDHPGQKTIWG